MSNVYECDCCGETFKRSYWAGAYKKVEAGSDTARISPTFRGKILRWLIGWPILRRWSDGYTPWDEYDLCRVCNIRMVEYMREGRQ